MADEEALLVSQLFADPNNAQQELATLFGLYHILEARVLKGKETTRAMLSKLSSFSVDSLRSLTRAENTPEQVEIEEMRKDEILALEAILGDEFTQFSVSWQNHNIHGIRVSMSASLTLDESCFRPYKVHINQFEMDFHILPAPISFYPFQIPIIIPRMDITVSNASLSLPESEKQLLLTNICSRIKLKLLSELIKQASTMLGESMVYSLTLWAQSNLSELIAGELSAEGYASTGKKNITPDSVKSLSSNGAAKVVAGRGPAAAKIVASRGAPTRRQQFIDLSDSQIEEVSRQMKDEQEKKIVDPAFCNMLTARQKLPAWKKKDEIVHLVRNNQVRGQS